jgi:hypothetical protein
MEENIAFDGNISRWKNVIEINVMVAVEVK